MKDGRLPYKLSNTGRFKKNEEKLNKMYLFIFHKVLDNDNRHITFSMYIPLFAPIQRVYHLGFIHAFFLAHTNGKQQATQQHLNEKKHSLFIVKNYIHCNSVQSKMNKIAPPPPTFAAIKTKYYKLASFSQ